MKSILYSVCPLANLSSFISKLFQKVAHTPCLPLCTHIVNFPCLRNGTIKAGHRLKDGTWGAQSPSSCSLDHTQLLNTTGGFNKRNVLDR